MSFSGVRSRLSCGFNITPIIDIVFLLMIFFLVECRFIEAENWPVDVPDACLSALSRQTARPQALTVTIMKEEAGTTEFAFGAEKIVDDDKYRLAGRIASLIDGQIDRAPSRRTVVTLRIDQNVRFYDAQYALLAVSLSRASDVKLAVVSRHRRR